MTRPDCLEAARTNLMQQMSTRCKACEACQVARATVETDAGFFLCEGCEAAIVVAFQEFELPSAPAMAD
jgi:hypothetical protein